jgi:hypothetical protein
MDPENILGFRTRRRIAKLWGVPPYRVDVRVDLVNLRMEATLDGNPPDQKQRAILEQDVLKSTQSFLRAMN